MTRDMGHFEGCRLPCGRGSGKFDDGDRRRRRLIAIVDRCFSPKEEQGYEGPFLIEAVAPVAGSEPETATRAKSAKVAKATGERPR